MENNKSFTGDSLEHDMEYIGAPGGGEDNGATVSYESIFKGGILYNTLKSFTPPVVDINFLLSDGILFNLKDYYVDGVFDAQLALQDGVPISAVINHILDFEQESVRLNYMNELMSEDYKFSHSFEKLINDYKDYNSGKLTNVCINNDSSGMFSFDSSKCNPPPFKEASKKETYRPLPDCLTIKGSNIDGLGLFATTYIHKDTVLGVSHHYIKTPFSEELVRTSIGSFVNHSSEPNCTIEECNDGKGSGWNYKSYNLVTLRSIAENEEILLDYRVELCGLSGYDGAEFLK